MLALTHLPSPRMNDCLRSDLSTGPIDLERAAVQHAAYCSTLERHGAAVRVLNGSLNFPDCVFIEDTAVILDEAALISMPGHRARRGEILGVEPVLWEYREVHRVELPATLDGGDVLRIGKQILVGLSERTNAQGAEALQQFAARYGYQTTAIPLAAGLHFKSACTALPDGRLLVNPHWIDVRSLRPFDCLPIPASEPGAANVLLLGEVVISSASYPQTVELIKRQGFTVDHTPLSEFAKADGAVTCLSLLLKE